MVNQSTEKKNTRQIQMTIEGHKVTVSFAQEANPTLSALVRNTLLDAYIRKNGLCGEEQPAYKSGSEMLLFVVKTLIMCYTMQKGRDDQ